MPRWSLFVSGVFITTWMMLAAASIAAQNPGGSPEARKVKNPVKPSAASIKAGEQLSSQELSVLSRGHRTGQRAAGAQGREAREPRGRNVGSRIDRR